MRVWLAPALLVAGGLGLWLWKGSSAGEPTASSREVVAVATTTPAPAARAPIPVHAPAPTLERPVSDTGAVVKSSQVIVRINGTAITGRQLVAFGAADQQTMTVEMFDYLRKRAIDRELTFQAAQRAAIELSTAQLAELEQVRTNAKEHGITDAAEIELQVADARAGLLQSMLLAKAGTTLAAASADQIDREIGELPDDAVALQQARLQARQKLADEAQADYATKLRAYLDDLASKAAITN